VLYLKVPKIRLRTLYKSTQHFIAFKFVRQCFLKCAIINPYTHVTTQIFSFLKLPKKTDQKSRIRYPDLTKERLDIEIGNENGVVGQPDRIRSLRRMDEDGSLDRIGLNRIPGGLDRKKS